MVLRSARSTVRNISRKTLALAKIVQQQGRQREDATLAMVIGTENKKNVYFSEMTMISAQ